MTNHNYKKEISEIRERCFSPDLVQKTPRQTVIEFTKETDRILTETFDRIIGNSTLDVCLIALGGYGRRELCPYSDIDIMVLHNGTYPDERIGALVRALWDMGLILGCVVRNLYECKKILGEDLATDTALLESRFICGSKQIFKRLEQRILRPYFGQKKKFFTTEILLAIREGLFGNESALYVVEPNLKNGLCTLRDCQRVIWIESIIHNEHLSQDYERLLPFTKEEFARFRQGYDFVLSVRVMLHMAAGRRVDILEVPLQVVVAENLGYGQDSAGKLMELFFRAVRDIRHCLLKYSELRTSTRSIPGRARRWISAIPIGEHFKLLDGIIFVPGGPNSLPSTGSPLWIVDLFTVALSYNATLSVELVNHIRTTVGSMSKEEFATPEISAAFRKILSMNGRIGMVIRLMHDTGFLGAVVPEFEKLTCKVEYDTYHEFTVDQHTIMALSLLDNLDKDEELSIRTAFKAIPDLFLLRLALLLHDIGKALPGDHSYTGSIVAAQVCERLGLDNGDIQRVVFLIRQHLELTKLAFRREPEEQIIRRFAEVIGDRENLDLLYLLTVLDIRSVGRKTWTTWKGMELLVIYERTLAVLEDKDMGDFATKSSLAVLQSDEELVNGLLSRVVVKEDLVLHVDQFVGFERLIVNAYDRPHLFADIAGCLSSEGYNILSAQITTIGSKALDIFNVEVDESTHTPTLQRLNNLRKKWDLIHRGIITADHLIDERMRIYKPKVQRISSNPYTPVVRIHNDISPNYTVIEIEASDRFGLLYQVVRTLADFEINIFSAKLSTRVSRALDVFYVNYRNGKKIHDTTFCESLSNVLMPFF